MSTFSYQDSYPLSQDKTTYKLISSEHVSTLEVDGRKILKINPKAIELLAKQAMVDVSFLLRTSHL